MIASGLVLLPRYRLMAASAMSGNGRDGDPVVYRGAADCSRKAAGQGCYGQVWAGPLSEPIELKPPTVPILRSCEIAVTSCAGANGFVRRMLFGTPCTGH